MSQVHNICNVSEIPEGEARMFLVGETLLGIFNVNGEFFALNDLCPHAGASLSRGLIEGDVVRCRIHHWRFCIRNGLYLDEDKACFNVKTYLVRVVGEQVQVEL